eukprot:CAMPEP_0113935322 /NCGR_PEP_ID=MMETSP1339-20121228/2482_1 /TAXON_ID=94617 /ORGANISM="Fibrocapsa japonica" /LENGTH=193 /DNA_ID=CAMNT_0000937419 /DNA_START=99 /DNA_END=680 /DNA_ORIENTATION=+ /assembly_acc=CAM_ASM_000762
MIMKLITSALLVACASAFAPSITFTTKASALNAKICGPKEKMEDLRFGWGGTTAIFTKPARMLDDIRASGETIPDACKVFNANLEMDGNDIMFEDVMAIIDEHYETGLLEFKNGDILNAQGENGGSAKVLSYAALSNLDKETTLKLWGQYYRDVEASPDGTDHPNIRNFMNTGWDGVPFENGIALTRKNTVDS